MNNKTTAKIRRQVWAHKLRVVASILAIPAAIVGIWFLFLFDMQSSKVTIVEGEVLFWTRAQDETGSSTYALRVRLTDGSVVPATASRHGRAPGIGEQIELDKRELFGGRVRYNWKR